MLRKRFDHGRDLTALVMAFLVAVAVLACQGKIPAPMTDCAFASLVPSGTVVRASRPNSIVRQAGGDETPGGEPVGVMEAPEIPKTDAGKKKVSTSWVERTEKRLRGRPGKYMPVGAKPWHRPRFKKITVSVKLDTKQAANKKIMNQVLEELRAITGVVPEIVKATKNIAEINQRTGDPVGAKAEMETFLMVDFLNRLNTIVLPRVRDFEGLDPTSFRRHGSRYMFSLPNQEPLKELDALIDDRELVHSFDIEIASNVFTYQAGMKLMKDFGFPFDDGELEE